MTATLEQAVDGPPFLLVTGGKGGVGKTTLAANLGLQLAGLGAAPLVCDLDFGLANLDVMLGLEPPRTVEDFLDGYAELGDCITHSPFELDVLAAGSGSVERSRPDPKRRQRLCDALARTSAGLVLGDSPAGIGDDVVEFAVRADRVLVVTTPEPAAVTDAYGVIKAIDGHAAARGREVPTPEIFVNLATDAGEARSIATKLAGVCERFLARVPRLAGWMPRSSEVLQGVLTQTPFVRRSPDSAAAKSLARLARRYAEFALPSGLRSASKPTSKASDELGR